MEAHAMETSIGGASQNMFCARKQSGMIQAMNGWKKLVLRTLTRRSMDRGANQESRWGGIAYGDDVLPVCITAGRRESIEMLVLVRMCQGREELGVLVCKTCWLSVVIRG